VFEPVEAVLRTICGRGLGRRVAFKNPGTPRDTEAKLDAVTDEPPWDERSVCEYNQTMKPGKDDVLRFVEHTRPKKLGNTA
jgi:hypothetical protein